MSVKNMSHLDSRHTMQAPKRAKPLSERLMARGPRRRAGRRSRHALKRLGLLV